jgi:hypothetical protein
LLRLYTSSSSSIGHAIIPNIPDVMPFRRF